MATEVAFDRSVNLRRLAQEHFDVLVVGGGITGAGVALDAATRGLRVALVERNDWASGTSSKSSKLVHGGLRYLNQRDYRLVYEALYERERLRRNAPHLVRLMPFLIPLFGKDGLIDPRLAKAVNWVLWLYDLTGGWRIGKLHKRIDAAAALKHLPTLNPERVQGAFIYYDAQTDDARLTLAVVQTAAQHGAVVANHCGVVGINANGREITLHPSIGESHIDPNKQQPGDIKVQATVVVNATGVWADELQTLVASRVAQDGEYQPTLRPAKGVHLVVPRQRLTNDIAAVLPVRGTKRSIFVVPKGDYTYIGTTDTDYNGPLEKPYCTSAEVDEVLAAVNAWTIDPLTRSDVRATWAGLRPLVATGNSNNTNHTADLSRRHSVTVSPDGLITVTGGKLTTYRRMAADTVDVVMKQLGRRVGLHNRCRTASLKIWGADGFDELTGTSASEHLDNRYGTMTPTIVAMIKTDPSLGELLIEELPYLRAEALYAVRYEMAMTLDDVLSRRVPARWLNTRITFTAAEATASLIGPELGWDEAETSRQITSFQMSLTDELAAAGLVTQLMTEPSNDPSNEEPTL
ncbi:MAG: FAD-dependent oxidoreductase [Acidimicrobiales bacterium]